MDPQTITEFVQFICQKQWLGASAIVIFLLVRLFKSDSPIAALARIPAKLRTLIAVLLGFAGAGIQAVTMGVPWKRALAENLVGALLAILTHDGWIEYIRQGRELFERKAP